MTKVTDSNKPIADRSAHEIEVTQEMIEKLKKSFGIAYEEWMLTLSEVEGLPVAAMSPDHLFEIFHKVILEKRKVQYERKLNIR